jgi:uncharacterized protein YjbI with pentapeptide repeats
MLRAIVTIGLLLSINSYAYNPLDLEKLKRTNSCVECDLSGANLSGMKFTKSNLSGSVFYGANLSQANFSGANLSDSDLYMTNLSEANLEHANLANADMRLSNLGGANLYGANLYGASLSKSPEAADSILRARNYKRP